LADGGSELFETLPYLNRLGRQLKLETQREELLHHRDAFSPSTIAPSLASLGMNPSSFAMNQIFEFLLGQVWASVFLDSYKLSRDTHLWMNLIALLIV